MEETQREVIDELQKVILDPNLIQGRALSNLNNALNGKLDLPDPTNPFIFLMENSALTTAAFAQEANNVMRNMYPSLADEKAKLYNHINASEIDGVFATPSKAMFNIFINKKDLINFGYETDMYYEILIPKYSYIEIEDTAFTLLNDITVRYYKNNKLFSKIIYGDLDIGYLNNTILETNMVSDNNNVEWIMITLEVKQYKRYKFRDLLIAMQPYKKDINIDDYYGYIRAKSLYKTTNTENYLNTTFSNFVYDPNRPTLIVRPMDNVVNIEIPSVYTLNNAIKSFIDIELFTTKGDIVLPLTNYSTSDFVFNLTMDNVNDARVAGIKNISFNVNTSTFTYSGKKEMTFEKLKQLIVNYSTGNNNLPITEEEIKKEVEEYGFLFRYNSDNILKREFIISKIISDLGYEIFSSIDMFYAVIDLYLPTINSSKIKTISDEKLIIEPFQLFNMENGVLKPLSDVEMATVKNNAITNISDYNKNDTFFNIYKYIIDYNNTNTNIRAYDVNQPSINSIKTLYNNNTLVSPITLQDRYIKNTNNKYELLLNFGSDDNLLSLNLNNLKLQFKIDLKNGEYVYFKGNLYQEDNEVKCNLLLNNNGYITKDNKILFITDEGSLHYGYVDLISDATITLYSIDQTLTDFNGDNVDNVVIDNATTILYEEEFNITFGIYLNNLFTNYNYKFMDRKFKTYGEDVYLRYKENVYALDSDGNISLTPIDTDGDGVDDDVELTILHHKGEIIVDDDGNNIIQHHKGDIMLDEDDKPIIDNIGGITHSVTMLLMEDNYLRATEPTYKDYRIDYFLHLTDIITIEIDILNKKLLENTTFKFLPINSIDDVILEIGYKKVNFNNFVTPQITIYVNNENSFHLTDETEQTIYAILQDNLYKNTTINIIENMITEKLGPDVLSVDIQGILNDDRINALTYENDSSRFVIRKILQKQNDGTTIVKPDVDIKIVNI